MATPILDGLIESGNIIIDGTEYVGIASDGVGVVIGYAFDPEAAERYLTDNPTPDRW